LLDSLLQEKMSDTNVPVENMEVVVEDSGQEPSDVAQAEPLADSENKPEPEATEAAKPALKGASVLQIIGKIKNDPKLSEKDKMETISLLLQKFVEENQALKGDIEIVSEQMNKQIEAKEAVKTLNEAYKKQIVLVREESKLRLEEEQAKRMDTVGGYSNSVTELSSLLETHSNQNGELRTSNTGMCEQMTDLVQQTEKREKFVEKMQMEFQLQIKLLEHQVTKAQIEKAEIKAELTKERLEISRELGLERERSVHMQDTVRILKEQAEIYQAQLDELQTGAGKTNTSFNHFKSQIDKLTNQMVSLEKDTALWRQKYEVSSQQVKKMNTATMDKDKEFGALTKKLDTMVKLNKTLSAERSTLLDKVKQLEN